MDSCLQSDQNTGNLKEELRAIIPQLEEMHKRKNDRLNQFNEVLGQMQKISMEIFGPGAYIPSDIVVDQNDLSTRKLDELHKQLQALQNEKVCAHLFPNRQTLWDCHVSLLVFILLIPFL